MDVDQSIAPEDDVGARANRHLNLSSDIPAANVPSRPEASHKWLEGEQEAHRMWRGGNDPATRRRLGELTKKLENLDLKYRNLREVGVKG
jgi:hypothetical protein